MPKYNYTFLAPLIPAYVDDGQRDLLAGCFSVPAVGDFKVTAIGRPSAVEMIRSEMVDGAGQYTEQQAQIESQLVEHMMSALRLTTNQQIEYLWFGQDRVLISNDGDAATGLPRCTIRLSSLSAADQFSDLKSTLLFFEHTAGHRDLFKLVSDAKQPTLPLPYRFLSLYKVLELEFKIAKKWPNLPELLHPYEAEYRSLKISNQTLDNCLHATRDLCAHIKLDNNSSRLGLTGLNNEELGRVEQLLRLLNKIVLNYLATKFPLRVHLASDLQSLAQSRVTAPEEKMRLDRVYDREQADSLERQAAHWDHEATRRPAAVADAFRDCARHARKVANLLKIGAV